MANTPFPSKRAPYFADIPDEKWKNWRWQLSNRLNSVEDFENIFPLTESERKALSAPGLFRVDVTPYFASLVDPDDPNDPIRKQIIPTAPELDVFTAQMEDSLAEDAHRAEGSRAAGIAKTDKRIGRAPLFACRSATDPQL